MKSAKKKRLEAKGWKFGTAREFLNLSEESAYVEQELPGIPSAQKTDSGGPCKALEIQSVKNCKNGSRRPIRLSRPACSLIVDLGRFKKTPRPNARLNLYISPWHAIRRKPCTKTHDRPGGHEEPSFRRSAYPF